MVWEREKKIEEDGGEVQVVEKDDEVEVEHIDEEEVEQVERVEKIVEVNLPCDPDENVTVEENQPSAELDQVVEIDEVAPDFIEVEDEEEVKELDRVESGAKPKPKNTKISLDLPDQQFELLEQWVKRGENLFQCQKCEKSFEKHQELIFHKLEAHYHPEPAPSLQFKCKICGKEFERENSVKKHEEQKHKQQKVQVLQHPENGDEQNQDVKEIQSTTKAKNEVKSPFPCDVCGKEFEREFSVRKHKEQSHKRNSEPEKDDQKVIIDTQETKPLGVKPYKCKICRKRFDKQLSVKKHKEQKHKTLDNDSKSFEKKIDVVTLEALTLTSKPFKCKICKKKFEKNISLRKHKEQKHKTSGQSDVKLEHKVISEKEETATSVLRPFKCNECRKRFEKEISLKKHKEQKHKGTAGPKEARTSALRSEAGFEQRQRILRECPYFRDRAKDTKNIKDIALLKPNEKLKDMACLPTGWKAQEKILSSGRKIVTFVHPDLSLVLRSRVGVFEYVKFYDSYSKEELEVIANKMGISTSKRAA